MDQPRRHVGVFGLMLTSVGGMIGSGWLFGPFYVAKLAGPYSMYPWFIGAVCILFIGLVYAELTTFCPRNGTLVHLSHLTHGLLIGRIWSWMLLLAYVAAPPTEVLAILSYANSYMPIFLVPATNELSMTGLITGAILLAIVVLLNYVAIKKVLLINNTITFWKLLIPIITIVIFLGLSFNPSNFIYAKHSISVSQVFSTVASAGVIYSFLGIRNAVVLSGECKNPSHAVPIALTCSILIMMLIYLGLQYSFITALPLDSINNGWSLLTFKNSAGPIAGLAVLIGAGWWSLVLYLDAFVSPAGASFIYVTTSSRIIVASGQMDSAPKFMSLASKKGVPWAALLVVFFLGLVFFFPFPSWRKIMTYVSAAIVLTLAIAPIVLLQLRMRLPEYDPPFRLWPAWIIAPIAFYIANAIIFWSGHYTLSFLFFVLLVFFVAYFCWYHFIKRLPAKDFGWQHFWWVFPYFFGLWVISYYGPSTFDGTGALSFGASMFIIFIFSIIVLFFALKSGMSKEEIESNFEAVLSK